jgi:hypothetical protein
MNSRFNNRLQNRDEPKQGNVASYFDNLKNLVQINDGTRSFVLKTVDCHDQSAPFNDSQDTRIAITHSDHHISQITDGFLTFKIRLMLQLTGIDQSNFEDDNHLCKMFIGFKSSNQILDQLNILCRNLDVGYQQNECIREGFAYSTIKPKQEKKTKKYTHSLYENVSNYSPSVCGAYINIVDFKDGLPHPVEFEMNLPFEDILALQAFDLYPNLLCGNLELKLRIKPRGLVWCMIDPAVVKNYKEYIEGQTIDLSFANNPSVLFRHAFTQIGNSAEVINKFTVDGSNVTTTKGDVRLACTGLTVLSLKSNMYGFNVVSSTLSHIEKIFSTPQIIPSQQLDYNSFPIPPSAAGIQSTINLPVTNCTCISLVFPKHDNDITVFENPIYSNLQLTVNGKNMPDEVVDSQGARFLQQQLVASDLSGGLECTKEFEDSMVMAKNTPAGTRYANCLSDGTSFIWNVQAERNNAGYTFDGIDSNGQNIPIQIRGQPTFTGVNDTYYNFKGDNSAHPPPPQIWLCRDTHFLVSTQGVVYVNNDTPADKQILE